MGEGLALGLAMSHFLWRQSPARRVSSPLPLPGAPTGLPSRPSRRNPGLAAPSRKPQPGSPGTPPHLGHFRGHPRPGNGRIVRACGANLGSGIGEEAGAGSAENSRRGRGVGGHRSAKGAGTGPRGPGRAMRGRGDYEGRWARGTERPSGRGRGAAAALTIFCSLRRHLSRHQHSRLLSHRRTATSSRGTAHTDGAAAPYHWPAP